MYKTATKSLNLLTGAIASLALFSATAAVAEPPAWAQKTDATIVGAAVALSGGLNAFDENSEDFDILVTAVVATGYAYDPLNGEDDYTVFAPTDGAFIALVTALADGYPTDDNMSGSIEDEVVDFLAGALGIDGIRAVLDYHVTEGVRNSRSVTNARAIKMLDGNTISAREGYIEANNSDAEFVDLNIRLNDGMIHVIDTVLLP